MKLAVIPARGGSKRIPRKNIKQFGGRPMISWSIEATQKTNLFDLIVVSTDDPEIAEVATTFGAEVPFLRPAGLSDDYTSTIPVVAHTVNWYLEREISIDEVCCIYATAPFIEARDIVTGFDVLLKSGADFASSVTSYAFPVQRALKLGKDGRVNMLDPSQFETRSQDLCEAYHDAGQFYWGTSTAWLSGKPIFGPHAAPVILPRYRVQDIDTIEDWKRAELMLTSLSSINGVI